MMIETRRRSRAHFDWPLLVAVYLLSFFGILCITMATYDVDKSAGVPLLNKILNSRSGMWQSIFVLVSPVVVGVIMAIPTQFIKGRVRLAYYAVLGLLVVTVLAGEVSNDLKGWLKTGFGRSIQPSEFAQLSVLLMLARVLSKSEKPMGTFKDFMRIMFLTGLPVLVVLMQGETGTVIVIAFIFMVMLYFGGVDIRIIIGLLSVAVIGATVLVVYGLMDENPDYRIMRLVSFIDPEKYSMHYGYQVIKSKTVIGSGQLTGLGTFQNGSWTTLGYVPESSTDFIITVVAESFGFVGCVGVLLVYLFIVLRMIYLARFTQDKFGQLVIIGVMAMIFFHVIQNVGMCIGIMPITGIPLPFLSYGGSNYMTNIAAIALVLNVTRGRSAASILTMPLPKINTGR